MKQNLTIIRRHLDSRFAKLRPAVPFAAKPPAGWIRSIRQGLGMNAAQLAERMGVSEPRVIALEHGEAAGATTLKSLQRAAEALNCTLVYALVPTEPLEKVVDSRARYVAAGRVADVEQTMRLENQSTGAESQRRQRKEVAEGLIAEPKGLWDRRD